MNVLLSAGHYPQKPGACWNGFCEHDEAARWAKELAETLGDIGHLVPVGTLKSKIDFIRQRSPTLAVEIHFNSAPDGPDADDAPDGAGCETLYYPGSDAGKLLALYVQSRLSRVFTPDRGVKEGWYQMNQAKGPDFFLAKTPCPAIIVEPAFITQKEVIQSRRSSGVAAIADGILEYLKLGEGTIV